MEDKVPSAAVMLTVRGAASCAYGPIAPRPEAEPVIAPCHDRTDATRFGTRAKIAGWRVGGESLSCG